MITDFKQPRITAKDDSEKIKQILSFLYQLVEQLNYVQKVTNSSTETVTAETLDSFNSIKDLIIKSADIVAAYTAQIKKSLQGVYVEKATFDRYIDFDESPDKINMLVSTAFTNGLTIGSKPFTIGTASGLPNVPVSGDGMYQKMTDGSYSYYLLIMGSGALYTGTQTGTGTITWTEK